MPQKIEISSRTIVFTVFFLLFLQMLWIVREVIYALFLAFIFMSALKPLVNRLEKSRIPRALAAFLVFMSALLSFIFILIFIFPPLIQESVLFLKNLPILIVDTFPFLSDYINAESLLRFLPDITQNFVRVVGGLFSNMIFLISIIFFTFYFLLEEKFLKNFLERFLDEDQSERIVAIAAKAEERMGAWVWGEILLMTVIGVMTYIGLVVVGIRFPLSLAFLAGLLEVIPIIGPTFAAIPAFFVAASTSFYMGGATLLLYFVIQQLENNLVVPVVMKKAVGLNPITTLIALSIGGKLGGLMGVILSVPAALFIETILVEVTKSKK